MESNRISGSLEQAEQIAEKLRREPYNLLTNDCITKSVRLRRACKLLGIPVRVVVCLGLVQAKWFGGWLTIPVIHGWGEVEGQRIETSRPLESAGIWQIVPAHIRPLVALRF